MKIYILGADTVMLSWPQPNRAGEQIITNRLALRTALEC